MSETARYLLLAVVTLLTSLLCTRLILFFARPSRESRLRFGSQERKEGKEQVYRHYPRRKKPLGGGVAIFIALLVGVAVSGFLGFDHTPVGDTPFSLLRISWIWVLCGLVFAAIGFIDDWRKITAAKGLNERTKLLLQAVAAIVFTALIIAIRDVPGQPPTAVFLPFVGWTPFYYFFWLFGVIVLVGASNAVNLIDGLDGLAGSSLLFSFAGYLVLAALLQHETTPALLPMLAIAAVLGFLVFNLPSAKIIMGDTGALGLGAALGALALLSGTEWLLLLLAAPFIITTISVIIQISVMKIFRGPIKLLRHQTTEVFRPFLVTPLHHHFQALNWGPWLILGLYAGTSVVIAALAILAFPAAYGSAAAGWFWVLGLIFQVGFLVYAAVQKAVQANYFLGLEAVEDAHERVLTLYKGLPVVFFGGPRYAVEYYTDISESMVNAIAAEGILWRSLSEIEAHVTLGKIYHANRHYDGAVEEWERVPQRNLLIRENLVTQLGEIYLKANEYLKAIKLLEQLPPGRLARIPGLPAEIQHAKVQIGNMAGKLYHHAMAHVAEVERATQEERTPARDELERLVRELEAAMQYTQQLRDLLDYERYKAERLGELESAEGGPDLYRRMDTILAVRRDELMEALRWARMLTEPAESAAARTPVMELADLLRMTPSEISLAMEVPGPLAVTAFARLAKPSRNTLYRVQIEPHAPLPPVLVAKCYEDEQVTFFSACYRRERGVLQILHEAGAPVPRPLGGYLGSHQAVLFMEEVGVQDLAGALSALPAGDRAGRLALLRRGLQMLTSLYTHVLPVLPRLEREVRKIVKEVLTPEYFSNAISIALNRILALRRGQLTVQQLGRLEVALRPIITTVQEAPKTFIHFEFTPGNVQMTDGHAAALDFEQSTFGPAAFDVASLLFAPENDLTDGEVESLLGFYHDQLPGEGQQLLAVSPSTLEAAAILKMIFYAGSAANFYRKFEDSARLDAMEWYLRTAERLLTRRPDAGELTDLLAICWPAEMRSAR